MPMIWSAEQIAAADVARTRLGEAKTAEDVRDVFTEFYPQIGWKALSRMFTLDQGVMKALHLDGSEPNAIEAYHIRSREG